MVVYASKLGLGQGLGIISRPVVHLGAGCYCPLSGCRPGMLLKFCRAQGSQLKMSVVPKLESQGQLGDLPHGGSGAETGIHLSSTFGK